MSDSLIPNTQEMVRQAHLSQLQQLFNEPYRLSWLPEEICQVEELYDIAVKLDTSDPVGWCQNFHLSHPNSLRIGAEKTRLARILHMARLYATRSQEPPKSISKREF